PHPRSRTLRPFVMPSRCTSASPLSRMVAAMRVKSPFSQSALFGFMGDHLRWANRWGNSAKSNSPVCRGISQNFLQHVSRHPGGAAPGCFLPNGPRRASDRQRALNHEASCWKPRVTRHPGRTEEYLFDDIPRLRRRQSLAKIGKRSVDVSIENLAKELFFVAKSSVKTGPIDAHGPRQV